jgi:hypothetical protein
MWGSWWAGVGGRGIEEKKRKEKKRERETRKLRGIKNEVGPLYNSEEEEEEEEEEEREQKKKKWAGNCRLRQI